MSRTKPKSDKALLELVSPGLGLMVSCSHGDMDNFLVSRMILCGIPLDEPYLQLRLSEHMNSEKKGLKNFKLPINDSYYLMGTVDPTGTLSCNQVCVILDSGQVSGEVLVYKHPGLHFGDVHVLTAIYVKDMKDIIGNAKYAILFPTKGQRFLADEIANSDFDGDMYWVSRNSEVYTQVFVIAEIFGSSNYAISEAADSWLAYMDRLLTLSDECVEEKECLREKNASILYGAMEFNESTRDREDIFKEAIAIYQVTSNYAKAEGDVGKCRFAWSVAGHALCALHANEQEKTPFSVSVGLSISDAAINLAFGEDRSKGMKRTATDLKRRARQREVATGQGPANLLSM
ncbi:putative RNA-dependent RNA polymerase 3 [Acorus calamus]|uniref:RNA-dependent RNA polymerase n=1 Tax=Acorus calamus TaxID=4465 RepID=A0AAV9CMR3_ACOCL|nr:putative RNA-dependent RNA polymerase 3 [Acorus calamus]